MSGEKKREDREGERKKETYTGKINRDAVWLVASQNVVVCVSR